MQMLSQLSVNGHSRPISMWGHWTREGPPGYDSPKAQMSLMSFLDYYTIVLGSEIVGGIMVGSAGKEHKVLERIFVDPTYHRKGIGARACELLWKRYPDAKLWTLGTPEWNVRTKEFYEKLGFVQIGWEYGNVDWRGRWYQMVMDPSYEMAEISDLADGIRHVTVEGTILEKSMTRTVRSRKGEPLSVSHATMGDESGTITLVLWNKQIRWVTVDGRVRVENGYVQSYRGTLQLTLGKAGRLILLVP